MFESLRNGVLFALAWVAWVACWRGWRTCVGSVLVWCDSVLVSIIIPIFIIEILSWRKKCWMFTFETKMKKMFQKDLNSDLKEEPDLKSRCCFTLLEPVMPGSWICLNPSVGKYTSICVTLWLCSNMREKLRA